MRELEPQLEEAGIDVLLVNIHDATGQVLMDRYDFRLSPTYLIFDSKGSQVWKGNLRPSLEDVLSRLGS